MSAAASAVACDHPRAPTTGKCGVYRELVEPERIVFTFAWEDANGSPGHELLTTVTLSEQGSKTLLTLHQAGFETTERRDDHVQGWTSCLDRFADYMATI